MVTLLGVGAVFGRCSAESGSKPAGGDQRAFRLVSINVDKADMDPGEGLAALHVHGLPDYPGTVGQMAAVPAGEAAGDLDIPDRIVVAVAQREGDQRLRAEAAPPPGLRGDLQAVEGGSRRRRLGCGDRRSRWRRRLLGRLDDGRLDGGRLVL